MGPVRTFDDEASEAESLLGTPRADLPSPMQRITNPLRRLVLRVMRVYWVQQLAVNRALLAAIRALRQESGDELAALRQKIAKLEDEVQSLRDRGDG